VSFRHEKFAPHGGPDGGNGGNGGNVVIQATKELNTLNHFLYQHYFTAENGENGRGGNKHGKNGNDLIIKVPIGTILIDENNGEIIADLDENGKSVIVAKGGKGGKGNKKFATSVERAPHYSEKGEKGEEKHIEVKLKILSDIGIIGLPNAGKSTLLKTVSNAKPTTADYPFTTLSPKIGVVKIGVGKRFIMADLPGLLEGASKGKGMGNEFLAHIERTKVLLFLIDGTNKKEILPTYNSLLNELRSYKPEILDKKRVVAINKIDLWNVKRTKEIKEKFKNIGEEVYFISALHKIGLEDLLERLYELAISSTTIKRKVTVKENTIRLSENDLKKFLRIERIDDHTVRVMQTEVERRVQLTNLDRPGSVAELLRFFKKINLERELRKVNIKDGDRVIIGNKSFIYKKDE